MEQAPAGDEFQHRPNEERLWNESYYFDFANDQIQGFTRLGFQPYERRANLWFFLFRDGRIVWHRDENIPIEDCYGLHVEQDGFAQTYDLVEPHERWRIEAEGTCATATEGRDVIVGTDETVSVDLELTFHDPIHDAYKITYPGRNQAHYDHYGQYEGRISIDGEDSDVDAFGYRDHSWGGLRDWTPGDFGHVWGSFRSPSDECFNVVAQLSRDGSIGDAFGYRASPTGRESVEEVNVTIDDGFDHETRGKEWTDGNLPRAVRFDVTFEESSEEFTCVPIDNAPLGYEDRNWELRDIETHRLASVHSRMPSNCTWRDTECIGWVDAIHPL